MSMRVMETVETTFPGGLSIEIFLPLGKPAQKLLEDAIRTEIERTWAKWLEAYRLKVMGINYERGTTVGFAEVLLEVQPEEFDSFKMLSHPKYRLEIAVEAVDSPSRTWWLIPGVNQFNGAGCAPGSMFDFDGGNIGQYDFGASRAGEVSDE